MQSLGLDTPLFEPKETIKKPKAAPKKRKQPPTPSEDSQQPAQKAARIDDAASEPDSGPIRRSARNRGKTVDYKSEQKISSPMPISFQAGIRVAGNEGPLGSGGGTKRIANP